MGQPYLVKKHFCFASLCFAVIPGVFGSACVTALLTSIFMCGHDVRGVPTALFLSTGGTSTGAPVCVSVFTKKKKMGFVII